MPLRPLDANSRCSPAPGKNASGSARITRSERRGARRRAEAVGARVDHLEALGLALEGAVAAAVVAPLGEPGGERRAPRLAGDDRGGKRALLALEVRHRGGRQRRRRRRGRRGRALVLAAPAQPQRGRQYDQDGAHQGRGSRGHGLRECRTAVLTVGPATRTLAAVPAPLAVYTDVVGADAAPGVALLEEAGFAVRVLAAHDPGADRPRGGRGRRAADRRLHARGRGAPRGAAAAAHRGHHVGRASTWSTWTAARARAIWVSNVPGAATEEVAVHAFAMGSQPAARAPVPRPQRARRALGRRLRAAAAAQRDDARRPRAGAHRPPGRPARPGRLRAGRRARPAGGSGRLAARASSAVERDALLAAADVAEPPPAAHARDPPRRSTPRRSPGCARARFLVNVSRGALVEPRRCSPRSTAGRLGGAALDVLEVEPPHPDDPLVGHPRTLVTPHVA